MQKTSFFSLLLAVSVSCCFMLACRKTTLPPPDQDCQPAHPNDTLTLLYPCDNMTDFIPDSFAWSTKVNLDGLYEMEIWRDTAGIKSNVYLNFYWSTYDLKQHSLVTKEFTLLPFTKYYWRMQYRHDGNELHFYTPIQSFVTGATPYSLPKEFRDKLQGKYAVTDTAFITECNYINGPSAPCVPQSYVSSQPNTELEISYNPDDPINVFGADTIAYVTLSGPFGTQRCKARSDGEIYWSSSTYYNYNYLGGSVHGNKIDLTHAYGSNMAPISTRHVYGGQRK